MPLLIGECVRLLVDDLPVLLGHRYDLANLADLRVLAKHPPQQRHQRSRQAAWPQQRDKWRQIEAVAAVEAGSIPRDHLGVPDRRPATTRPGVGAHQLGHQPAKDLVEALSGSRLQRRKLLVCEHILHPKEAVSCVSSGRVLSGVNWSWLWRRHRVLLASGRHPAARPARRGDIVGGAKRIKSKPISRPIGLPHAKHCPPMTVL